MFGQGAAVPGTNFGGGFRGFHGQDFSGGIQSEQQLEELAKAVQTAGDPNVLDFKGTLTGVPAIRYEVLDSAMRSVTERESIFPLFKKLSRYKTKSSVAEWATRTGIGGDVAGSYHGEYSSIRKARAEYERSLVRIKYLMEGAEVTLAAKLQGTIEEVRAGENKAATMRILRSMEWGILAGDETLNPMQIDGIESQLRAKHPDHIFDLDGSSDTDELYQTMFTAFERVGTVDGGYGKLTDVVLSRTVQTDLCRRHMVTTNN